MVKNINFFTFFTLLMKFWEQAHLVETCKKMSGFFCVTILLQKLLAKNTKNIQLTFDPISGDRWSQKF